MRLFERIVVATDSSEVEALCRELGAPVVMTRADHPSGTDRVAEVVERPEFRDFPVVVNIQGDEPLVSEDHLARVIALVREGGWEVGTCAAPVRTLAAFRDPGVVKVVRGTDGRGLYFSRAPIPHRRDADPGDVELGSPPFLRHVGVYAYRREALLRWVSLVPSPLETLERLEQLRALENGIEIGVALVDRAARGVDTEEDARAIEPLLAASMDSGARNRNSSSWTLTRT